MYYFLKFFRYSDPFKDSFSPIEESLANLLLFKENPHKLKKLNNLCQPVLNCILYVKVES